MLAKDSDKSYMSCTISFYEDIFLALSIISLFFTMKKYRNKARRFQRQTEVV